MADTSRKNMDFMDTYYARRDDGRKHEEDMAADAVRRGLVADMRKKVDLERPGKALAKQVVRLSRKVSAERRRGSRTRKRVETLRTKIASLERAQSATSSRRTPMSPLAASSKATSGAVRAHRRPSSSGLQPSRGAAVSVPEVPQLKLGLPVSEAARSNTVRSAMHSPISSKTRRRAASARPYVADDEPPIQPVETPTVRPPFWVDTPFNRQYVAYAREVKAARAEKREPAVPESLIPPPVEDPPEFAKHRLKYCDVVRIKMQQTVGKAYADPKRIAWLESGHTFGRKYTSPIKQVVDYKAKVGSPAQPMYSKPGGVHFGIKYSGITRETEAMLKNLQFELN